MDDFWVAADRVYESGRARCVNAQTDVFNTVSVRRVRGLHKTLNVICCLQRTTMQPTDVKSGAHFVTHKAWANATV